MKKSHFCACSDFVCRTAVSLQKEQEQVVDGIHNRGGMNQTAC